MAKVAVVTGGNKGVGLAVVRALCKQFKGDVYLTARNSKLGEEAVEALEKEGLSPRFHQLDIDDPQSIKVLRDFLKEKYGGLDVLVNNAGIAFKVADTSPFSVQAEVTMKTNFYGTRDVSHELLPLIKPHAADTTPFAIQAPVIMQTNFYGNRDVCNALLTLIKPHGRVVNVSSMLGHGCLGQCSPRLQQEFRRDSITEDELVELMEKFVEDAKKGDHLKEGWPDMAYGTSKIGLTVLSKIQARILDATRKEDGILLNACCPGWIKTDLGGPNAPKSVEEGAKTVLYLALLPPDVTSPHGEMINEMKVVEW
uniref:carbonyl reductase (NADPH) n=1 Tax=Leptobrachium leishanense TaxID=445787 RepID=A0A8C5MAW9_9ANUR